VLCAVTRRHCSPHPGVHRDRGRKSLRCARRPPKIA